MLAAIRLEAHGQVAETDSTPAPRFIKGDRGLEASGSGPTQSELTAAHTNAVDWLYHTHDYSGRRYVELEQIRRGNANQLTAVCAFQLGGDHTFQAGPIVYRGVMYVSTTRLTAALDAATCRALWRHEWEPRDAEPWPNNRGVAITDGRVVRGTADGYLLALDATDGRLLWASHVAEPVLGETITMPPMIYEDLVLIGPAGSENNISGWVGAFRLEDGQPVWKFKTVLGASEEGGQAWPNPEGIPLGGGAVWTPLALDVEREELYVAVTNPAPDFPAHLRPGPNLYTNSLVALDGDLIVFDARTGGELYRFNTGGPIGGGIVTYSVDGRQYIATTSGQASGNFSNEGAPVVFVFALPSGAR